MLNPITVNECNFLMARQRKRHFSHFSVITLHSKDLQTTLSWLQALPHFDLENRVTKKNGRKGITLFEAVIEHHLSIGLLLFCKRSAANSAPYLYPSAAFSTNRVRIDFRPANFRQTFFHLHSAILRPTVFRQYIFFVHCFFSFRIFSLDNYSLLHFFVYIVFRTTMHMQYFRIFFRLGVFSFAHFIRVESRFNQREVLKLIYLF